MNDKELIIKDQVEVGDCPLHGYITIQDRNGKYLVKKHNMIVNSGRQYLLNKAFNVSAVANTSINSIYFGINGDLTTPDMTFNSSNVVVSANIVYESSSNFFASTYTIPEISSSSNTAYYTIDASNNYMVIKTKLTNNTVTTAQTIKEIGLVLNGNDDNELFSRVVHEPITIGPNMSSYTVTYYVYF